MPSASRRLRLVIARYFAAGLYVVPVVEDLVDAYAAYVDRSRQLGGRVFNVGGGPRFTMSLLELLSILEDGLAKKIGPSYAKWRPADQKVYISDIRGASEGLDWEPRTRPEEGVRRILDWIRTDYPT